jgi:hypothetical protein
LVWRDRFTGETPVALSVIVRVWLREDDLIIHRRETIQHLITGRREKVSEPARRAAVLGEGVVALAGFSIDHGLPGLPLRLRRIFAAGDTEQVGERLAITDEETPVMDHLAIFLADRGNRLGLDPRSWTSVS